MNDYPHFLIIGNIDGKRIKLFTASLSKFGISDYGLVSYTQLIRDTPFILTHIKKDTIIRLESPGQNSIQTKSLISLGASAKEANTRFHKGSARFHKGSDKTTLRKYHYAPPSKINMIKDEKGKILFPWQWFEGYKSFLSELKTTVDSVKDRKVKFMNDPDDIAVMFDKTICQTILKQNGLPVPEITGTFSNYKELSAILKNYNVNRLFIKIPAGSSASCIAAYHNDGISEYVVTTMELKRKNSSITFYDSRKIRRYVDKKDILDIIDWFSKENVHTEFWMDKKKYESKEFDMRILIIRGKPYHCVVRSSDTPFTNLHLGNKRSDLDDKLKADLPWNEIEDICDKIGRIFNNSLYCGADIMVSNDGKPYVLELNAFGDHLNDIYHEGLTSHDAELKVILNERGLK